jgi:F5/8 type C domain
MLVACAWLRFAALGCDDPEAFRASATVIAGAAGAPGSGVAGLTGAAGMTGTGGVGGDPSGLAGTTGQGGVAGADTSGVAGSAGVAGQGGAPPDAATDAAVVVDTAADADAAGAGGAVGTAGSGGGAGAAGGRDAGGGSAGAAGAPDFCDRARWTATALVTGGDGAGPPGGIDGDLTTRWANNRGQNGTDFYAVDFGGTVKLSKITLNDTQTYPDDYPGAYAVYGSADGKTFDGAPFVTGAGTTGSTVIAFASRSVRAVRVNQTGTSRSGNWWQIGEFQVVCAP